jgi:EmrB/QacA subfamily drug resistance transporter
MVNATVDEFSAAAGGGRRQWLMLVVILTGLYMQMLDTTITTVAVPAIQRSLDATFGEVQLVLAGYSLAFACMLITGGRLGDIHGRRRLFWLGMLGFTAASALCGAAPDPRTLVVARIVQGACSGLMFPQVLAIIQVSVPAKDKARAYAVYGATVGLGAITGPVLGGALIALNPFGADWRAIFFVNLPIGLVALALAPGVLTESTAPDADRLDIAGVLLVTTGLFLLVLPLVIGRDQGWPAWTFAMMAVSVPVLGAFAWYEARLSRRSGTSPLLRTQLFRQRSFTVGILLCLCFFAAVPSFFFTFLLTLQVGFGYSAVSAGAVTLAFAGTVAIASARSTAVVRHLGTWTLALGSALAAVGAVTIVLTLHAAGTGLKGWYLIPALMVAGVGGGLVLAPVTSVILAGVHQDDAGAASGALATLQQIGSAAGIAVMGVIFFGLLGANADRSADQAVAGLRSDLAAVHVTGPQAGQIEQAFRVCFHDKANLNDPSGTPASCRRIARQVAASPAPPATKAAVGHAVQDRAAALARKHDFSRTLQQGLGWQLGAFGATFLLVLALPKVRPDTDLPLAAA